MENEYLIQEANPHDTLTDEQSQHLEAIDSWIDDLIVTMEESKEYGVWGAVFRRAERRDFPQYFSNK